jgi:hypothetical protein
MRPAGRHIIVESCTALRFMDRVLSMLNVQKVLLPSLCFRSIVIVRDLHGIASLHVNA